MLTDTSKSRFGAVQSLKWNAVAWKDESFWGSVFSTCAAVTVPHIQSLFEDNDISHVVENFKIASQLETGDFAGTPFGDGDFYKWMESAMYVAAKTDDQRLFQMLDDYIKIIGKAQQPDGYISTKQIIGERQGKETRLGDINDFEVYNFGHLFTAACLHKRLTGKEDFLQISVKAADYLLHLYEEAAQTGEVQTAVCPSHYMGLVELYRTTKDEKYLMLARLSIEMRDSVEHGTDDNQDRLKLKDHEKILGHAVRANYLYAGVCDLYLEEGNQENLAMIDKVWNNLMEQKIYITGGCGALYNGVSPYGNFWADQKTHQAYGYEYQLPNVTAYNETCASIGHVLWAHRLFMIRPEAKYFDVIERAMLNVNLASISLSGNKFFYENMLRRAKELPYELCWPLEREEYIESFCCPPNITRLLSQTSEYAYHISENKVWTGLYGSNKADITLENGSFFTLHQETQYPWDGRINFSVTDIKKDCGAELMLRIPSWVTSGTLVINGDESTLSTRHSETYYTVALDTLEGSSVSLTLDMPVRFTVSNSLVEENTNQLAVERGPLVYCVEGMDSKQPLDSLLIDPTEEFDLEEYDIQGHAVQAIRGKMSVRKDLTTEENSLYRTFLPQELAQHRCA